MEFVRAVSKRRIPLVKRANHHRSALVRPDEDVSEDFSRQWIRPAKYRLRVEHEFTWLCAGQFELVQQGWINNPQFSSLHDERDPLLAERQQSGCVMTVQAMPTNLRIDALKQFVTVKGGAYFFMPGKRAADWLVNS